MKYVWATLFIGLFTGGWADFYQTTFTAAQSEWQYNFLYSLQMGVHNEGNTYAVAYNPLRITGDGLTAAYYNELYGFYLRKTNVLYNASPENPIGYEITRTYINIDPDEGINPESGRMRTAFQLLWVQHDPSVSAGGQFLPNIVYFSELCRPQLGTNDGLPSEPDVLPRSFWTADLAYTRNSSFPMASLTPPNGSGSHDLSGIFHWGYDDGWGMNKYEGLGDTANPNFNNNNVVRLRVTIDGQYAYFYVNPNPDNAAKTDYDGTARPATYYSNQFYFVAKVPVTFASNLVPMFGVANNRQDAERLAYTLSDFTIRTIAASNIAEISPIKTKAGSTNLLKIAIQPRFSSVNEAGVQEVYLELPDSYLSFTNWAAFTNAIGIFWAQTNASQTIYRTFTKSFSDANPAAGSVSLSLKDGGKTLKIRFNAGASPDVFHPNYSGFGGSIATTHQYMILIVVSNFTTSTSGDTIGKTLSVYVNNEKYADTTWTQTATTGRAKCYAGDVTFFSGYEADGNTLTFRTASDPVGIASIRPNFVYEGESKTWFIDVAAKDTNETVNNNADIAQVDIYFPIGFDIQLGSWASERLTNAASFSYDSGQRKLSVFYTNENRFLIAGSGIDTISVINVSTTNLDTIPPAGTNELSNTIVVVSYSALPGTKPVTNGVSFSYPLQSFLVRKKPPKAYGALLPTEVSNTLVSNFYTYVIQNKADNAGNNIRKVLIRLDKKFTNVVNVTADRPASVATFYNITNGTITNTQGYWWIVVDYAAMNTNVVKGGSATVSFWAYDVVPSLSAVTVATNIAYVDNFNGDGWMPALEEQTMGWRTVFYTPPALVRSYLIAPLNEDGVLDAFYNHHRYTDKDDSFLVRLRAKNWGESENDIYKIRVTLPYGLTNVDSYSSLKISSADIRKYTTNAGSNWVVEFFYTNSPMVPGDHDDLTFWVQDDIHAPTTLTFTVEAANTTNYAVGGLEGSDNLELRFIYPRPRARGYVIVPNGYIDAATNEYTIYYAITNTGNYENQIKELYLLINTNYITNITFISSALGGSFTGFIPDTPPYYRMQVQYYTTFYGGSNELLTFKVYDKVETKAEFAIYAAVSNLRMWTNSIGVVSGQTNLVRVIAPPTFYAYGIDQTVALHPTTSQATNLAVVRARVTNLGWGSNRLHKIRFFIPMGLTNQLLMVSNARLQATNTASGPVRLVASNHIEISYIDGGIELQPGEADDTYFTFGIFTNQALVGSILMFAANNSTNDDGSYNWTNYWTNLVILSGTNALTVVDTPRFYVSVTNIATPATMTLVSNRIENGTEVTGRRIRRVELLYDPAFVTNIVVVSSGSGGSATVVGGTNVIIDYSPGIDPNAGRWIVLQVYDNWIEGNTNMLVRSRVYYENDPLSSGYDAQVKESYTAMIAFNNPVVAAQVNVAPSVVWQDFPGTNYTIMITNIGDVGNDIKWVRIFSPSFITNITSVVSAKGGTVFIYPEEVDIYYTNVTFGAGEYDTISFVGLDNVESSEVSAPWTIKVNNTLQASLEQTVGVIPGGSLILTIKRPPYQVNYFLEFTNSVNSLQRTKMYATDETNYILLKVNNTGSTGNDITAVRLVIPSIYAGGDELLITNGMVASSSRSGAVVAISNDSIWVDYSANPLLPMESDQLLITLRDRIDHFETNLSWTMYAALNTTANTYKPASVQVGQSATLSYVMPSPQAYVMLTPSEVYNERKLFWLGVKVSNTGRGTSDIDRVTITLPSILQSGFTVSRVSNTIATGTNYASGVLTLSYSTPLAPNTADMIYLLVSNTALAIEDATLGVTVRNFVYTAPATGNTTLSLSTLPSFYTYVNGSEASHSVDTTTVSNTYYVSLDNSVNTSLKVKRIRVRFPDWFTNKVSYKSLRYITNTAHITGDPTNVVVDYEADGRLVVSGDYDVVEAVLLDDRRIGNFSNWILVDVDDGLALGEADRWISLPVQSSKTNIVHFVMPEPDALQSIKTTTIYVDTEHTNTVVWITNRATTDNPLAMARIWLPVGVSNIQTLTSAKGSAMYDPTLHRIVIDYRNTGLLNAGERDDVSFEFDNLYRVPTNVAFVVETVNLTNEADMSFVTIAGLNGMSSLMKVNYPPVAVEGSFYGDNRLYLIDTNATLIYRILNRTFESVVTQAVITFESSEPVTNIFESIQLANTKATVSQPPTNINQFILSYAAGDAIAQGYYEDINIRFAYRQTNTRLIPLTVRVWLQKVGTEGTNVDGLKVLSPSADANNLYLTNANWGVVIGSVFPTNRIANVKIYTPGSGTTAVDIDGKVLSTASRVPEGTYELRKVTPGDYDVEFSAPYYRTIRYRTNIAADAITVLPQIAMRNAPLIGNEDEVQVVQCYEESNTMVVFPGQSVGKEFSVDITREPFTVPQKRNLSENKTVKAPSSAENMYGYRMRLATRDDKPMDGAVVKRDAILYLAYDAADITARGWSEDDLAIYYWDDNGGNPRWVRVGGDVDKTAKRVVAKVGYVHSFYAVLAKSGEERPGVITAVTLRPKVFTPSRSGDGYYGSVRVTIEFRQPVERYEVKIFDLKGNLIKRFVRTDGPYTQGEVAWDGKDTEGYDVKNGVYVYKIYANGETYSGTLVIAR